MTLWCTEAGVEDLIKYHDLNAYGEVTAEVHIINLTTRWRGMVRAVTAVPYRCELLVGH
jgi:hypothetical protein